MYMSKTNNLKDLTQLIQKRIHAIEKLALANIEYKKAVQEKYGHYKDDESLYVIITGKPWLHYLKSGCSASMINRDIPSEFDFGETYRRLSK